MRRLEVCTLCLFSMLLLATRGQGQNSKPTLVNGVVSYVENGQRKEINVGKKCADLWVSPDGAVVAFIGIDKAERGDFIVESSVYIAKKVDRFKPQAIPVKPFTLHGRSWSVVRSPSLSPDLETLYFLVPEFAASATLMQMSLPRGTPQSIRDAAGYAVIWNGKDSGDLLLQVRDHNKEGAIYPCHLRTRSGAETVVADDAHCWTPDFFKEWTREHGGTISLPGRTH